MQYRVNIISKKIAMKSYNFILITAIEACKLDLNVLVKGPL